MSITKVFGLALFLVFGTLLFSCTDQKDQKVGAIEIINPIPDKEKMIVGEIAPLPQNNITLDSIQTIPNIGTVDGTISYIEEQHVAGGVAYYHEPILPDSILPIQDSGIIKTVPHVEERMMGVMVVNHIPVDSTTTSSDSLAEKKSPVINDNVSSKTTDLSVYPNPSKGEFTIKYEVTKRADVKLDIYDIKGVHIKTISNTANQYEGKYQIPVSLNEFPSGVYIVTLINGEKRSSEKVVVEK